MTRSCWPLLVLAQSVLTAALLSGCSTSTPTQAVLPTFTPRSLAGASPTPNNEPYIPTLTPIPLGQLPNVLATYRFQVTLDYVGHRAQVVQAVELVNPGPDAWDSALFQLPAAVQSPAFILNSITLPGLDGPINASYQKNGYLLRVLLPDGLAAGAGTTITLNYGLAAQSSQAAGGSAEGSIAYTSDVIQFLNWYPVLAPYQPGLGWLAVGAAAGSPLPGDPVYTESAMYELYVTAPDGVTVASGGAISNAGGRWRFVLKNARTIAFSASDKYASITQTEGGVVITSYFLAGQTDAGRDTLVAAAQSLALFNDNFGPYPYTSLVIAENAVGSSSTATGIVLHGGLGYRDYTGQPDSLLIATLPQAVARLWWGQVVSGDSFNQPWLNEAIPMYSEYLFIQEFHPELETWYWDSRVNYWQPEGLLGRPASDFTDTEDYLRNLLRRGAQFMHGLRIEIGDEAFFDFLRDYYRNGAYRIVTAADFFNALRRHTDSNLEELLTTYFIGQAMPTAAPTLTPVATEPPPGPPTPTPVIHVVKAGESLTLIARQYGVTVEGLVQANGLSDPNSIYAGQRLIIPPP